jgi:N-acetylglucosamine-6-phosphate deacetylase
MRAGGLPDGNYTLGELKVIVESGVARTESGALAGSTAALINEVKNMHFALGVPLAEAVRMATATPARALGIFDQCGSVAVGKRADLVAVDDALNIKYVILNGEVKLQND